MRRSGSGTRAPCCWRRLAMQLSLGGPAHVLSGTDSTDRGCVCVAQDLHKLLVRQPHVARSKEAKVFGAVALLDGQQFLRAETAPRAA